MPVNTMPNVAMPSFFIDSLRLSRASSYGGGGGGRNSQHSGPDSDGAEEPELAPPRASLTDAGASSLTPFQPQRPALLPGEGRVASASEANLLSKEVVPVSLAAQSIIKSGPLKKHSRNVTGVWQVRFVVLEGSPTHVMVYYYASAAAEASASKPRGVVPLSEVSVQRFGKDNMSFRVRAPQRSYEFRAPTPEEAQDWIRCIGAAAESARYAKAAGSAGAPPTLGALGAGARSGRSGGGGPPGSSTKSFSEDGESDRREDSDCGAGPSGSGTRAGAAAGGAGAGAACCGSSSSASAGGAGRQVTIAQHSSVAMMHQSPSPGAGGGASKQPPRGILSRALPTRRNDKASKPAMPAMLSRSETWMDITSSSGAPLPRTSPPVSVSEDGAGTPRAPTLQVSNDL